MPSYSLSYSLANDSYHLGYSPNEGIPETSPTENYFSDGVLVPEGAWTAFASPYMIARYGGIGLILLLESGGALEFLAHAHPPPNTDDRLFVPFSERLTLRIEHFEDGTLVFSHSSDLNEWTEEARFTPAAPVKEAGVILRYDQVDKGTSGLVSQATLVEGIWQHLVEEAFIAEPAQVVPRDIEQPPLPTVTSTAEPLVHAIVGAQFGDLEFDVGKSVRWTQWYVDNLFVLDVNLGTPRYWIVNWTQTFPDAEHSVTGINYFVLPIEFRKEQWRKYKLTFGEPHDDDWFLFVDAHEGLSVDNRTLPDDYDFAPFKSFLWREIQRAIDGGKPYAVLPYYAFLRSGTPVNVTYPTKLDQIDPDDPSTGEVQPVIQALSVPYYQPHKGLKRLWSAAELKKTDFDWTQIDTPVDWDVKPGTGIPQVDGYLTPTIGTVTTPDPGPLPADYTVVFDAVGPSVATGSLVGQNENSSSQRSWIVQRSLAGALLLFVYPSGAASPTSNVSVPIQAVTGVREKLALSIQTDNGAGRGVGKSWKNVGGVWTAGSTVTHASSTLASWDSTLAMRIGGQAPTFALWEGRIYSVELRTGLDPAAGTVLWRFDANDIPTISTVLDDTLDLDANADGIADGWRARVGGSGATAASRSIVGGAQRIVASPNANGASYGIELETTIPCVAGDVISGAILCSYTSGNPSAVTANLHAGFRTAADVEIVPNGLNVTIPAGTTWVPFSMTAPASTAYMRPFVRIFGNSVAANGTVAATFDVYAIRLAKNGLSYTDPRGRTWTMTNPLAVTSEVDAVPAVPSAKAQILSYGYAHWNLQDIEPPETTVPPIDAENDDGWRMRNLLSRVRAIPGLPIGDTWVSPTSDPAGLPGPWAPADANNPDPNDPDTGYPLPQPVPPDPSLLGLVTPLYDCVFRINMRDGVWYESGLSGNIPLIWDEASQTWTTNYDPETWSDTGVKSWDPEAVPDPIP